MAEEDEKIVVAVYVNDIDVGRLFPNWGKEVADFGDAFAVLCNDKLLPRTTSYGEEFPDEYDLRVVSHNGFPKPMYEKDAKMLFEIKEGALKAFKALYDRGKGDGSNLLRSLNSGDLTLKDFEEKTEDL